MTESLSPDLTSASLTLILSRIGCKTLRAVELFNLDKDDSIQSFQSLILFYRWTSNPPEPEWNSQHASNVDLSHHGDEVWFANQIIDSASVVQALVMAAMNSNEGVKIGARLERLREFTRDMPAELKSLVVREDDEVLPIVKEIENGIGGEDNVWYYSVWVQGQSMRPGIYRLDGMGEKPECIGVVQKDEFWTRYAREELLSKIKELREYDIEFRIFALTTNGEERDKMDVVVDGEVNVSQDTGPNGERSKKNLKLNGDAELSRSKESAMIKSGIVKKRRLTKEYRRFDFEPFLTEMLKVLASKGVLLRMVDRCLAEVEDDEGFRIKKTEGPILGKGGK